MGGEEQEKAKGKRHKAQGTSQEAVMANKAGRNDVCPCGSKKKFKKCCGAKEKSNRGNVFLTGLVVALVAGGLAAAVIGYTSEGSSQAGPGKVWSTEHGHYH